MLREIKFIHGVLCLRIAFFFFFFLFAPMAYESSQARDWIQATAEITLDPFNPLCQTGDQTHASTATWTTAVWFLTHCAMVETPEYIFFSFFFFSSSLFNPCFLRHMEVHRPEIKLELQLQAYITAWGNNGTLTHWTRPGIKPSTSWTLCQVLNPLSHNGNSLNIYFFELMFLFPLDIHPEVELLDHIMVVPSLVFWETSIPFSTVMTPIYTSSNSMQWLPTLKFLANICYL